MTLDRTIEHLGDVTCNGCGERTRTFHVAFTDDPCAEPVCPRCADVEVVRTASPAAAAIFSHLLRASVRS